MEALWREAVLGEDGEVDSHREVVFTNLLRLLARVNTSSVENELSFYQESIDNAKPHFKFTYSEGKIKIRLDDEDVVKILKKKDGKWESLTDIKILDPHKMTEEQNDVFEDTSEEGELYALRRATFAEPLGALFLEDLDVAEVSFIEHMIHRLLDSKSVENFSIKENGIEIKGVVHNIPSTGSEMMDADWIEMLEKVVA